MIQRMMLIAAMGPMFGSMLACSDASTSLAASDESDVARDPEAALAEIPSDMLPATLIPELKNKLIVPNVKNGGVAMFTDVVTIEPGADVTYCTYVAGTTREPTYIHNTLGAQSKYGHHAILQFTTTPQPPGTHACGQESLEAQQGQIIGGTGGEGTADLELPENVVSEVPAGAQFIINHHWINWSDVALEVQAEMITIPPSARENLVIARAMTVVAADFNVPAHETSNHSSVCTFGEPMDLLTLLGHQHRWGVHVKAERMGDAPDVIFDHAYDEAMISHPFVRAYGLEDPYHFNAGDSVRMTCQWSNTTSEALTFPHEMCVLFGWRVGGDRDATCYNGQWF